MKVDAGEENSPAAPAGTRTQNLSITYPTFYPLSYLRSPAVAVCQYTCLVPSIYCQFDYHLSSTSVLDQTYVKVKAMHDQYSLQ